MTVDFTNHGMPYTPPDDVSGLIRQAREILRPTPVRLHHAPGWFSRVVQRAYGRGCQGATLLEQIARLTDHAADSRWLDHWGSTKLPDGRVAFASEPYDLSPSAVTMLARFAEDIGCEFWVSPNSWWYPGATIRLLFAQSS